MTPTLRTTAPITLLPETHPPYPGKRQTVVDTGGSDCHSEDKRQGHPVCVMDPQEHNRPGGNRRRHSFC